MYFYKESCRNFVRRHPGKEIAKEDVGDVLKLLGVSQRQLVTWLVSFENVDYPDSPNILADDIFEYEFVPVLIGAEDVVYSSASSSTVTSFQELSLVPVTTFRIDWSIGRGRKREGSAVVTSAAFRERKTESERADRKVESKTGVLKWRKLLFVIQSDDSGRMHPAPRVTPTAMKTAVLCSVVAFTMTTLANNGLNVSATVEDVFMKRA